MFISSSLNVTESVEKSDLVVEAFDRLVNKISDAFVIISSSGVIQQFCGKSFELFDSKIGEGDEIWDHLDQVAKTILEKHLNLAHSTNKNQEFDLWFDGAHKKSLIHFEIYPVKKIFYLITLKDETQKAEQREAEKEKEQKEYMDHLTFGLAHQFNNFHHAALGFLENALDIKNGDHIHSEMIQESICQIKKAVALTQRALDLSEDPAENHVFVPLRKVLLNLKSSLAIEISQVDFEEDVSVSLDRPLPLSLTEVLKHLVRNAVQATVTREKKKIVLSVKPSPSGVRFLISDNGVGIPKKNQTSVFNPFYSTKGEFAGAESAWSHMKALGLGLTISKRLMREMGGKVELLSSSDQGSTFEVRLFVSASNFEKKEARTPQARTRALKKKTLSMKRKRGKQKLKFVIIDDLAENRLILRHYLQERAKTMREYDCGRIAISEMDQFQPDAIFMDWFMPVASGHHLLTELKQSGRKDLLKKVYICSGSANLSEIQEWQPLVGGVISKPVTKQKILELMS